MNKPYETPECCMTDRNFVDLVVGGLFVYIIIIGLYTVEWRVCEVTTNNYYFLACLNGDV